MDNGRGKILLDLDKAMKAFFVLWTLLIVFFGLVYLIKGHSPSIAWPLLYLLGPVFTAGYFLGRNTGE